MQSSCGIVDDIEDILKQDGLNEIDEFSRANNKSFILPKSLKKSRSVPTDEDNDQEIEKPDENSSNVPGYAAIYVKTWGCTHNGSDGEYMAGQLAAYGYKLVGNKKIFNSLILHSLINFKNLLNYSNFR